MRAGLRVPQGTFLNLETISLLLQHLCIQHPNTLTVWNNYISFVGYTHPKEGTSAR